MIEALVSEDLITFYEIYEKFDKIGIYKSNWENEVSSNLNSIELPIPFGQVQVEND